MIEINACKKYLFKVCINLINYLHKPHFPVSNDYYNILNLLTNYGEKKCSLVLCSHSIYCDKKFKEPEV